MENLFNSDQAEFFFSILSNPEKVSHNEAEKLESLVKKYPHVGILRALLARAYKDTSESEFNEKLKSASAYASDRAVLYKIINQPEKLHSDWAALSSVDEHVEIATEDVTNLPANEPEIAFMSDGAEPIQETETTMLAQAPTEEEEPVYDEIAPFDQSIEETMADRLEEEPVDNEVDLHTPVEEPEPEEQEQREEGDSELMIEEPQGDELEEIAIDRDGQVEDIPAPSSDESQALEREDELSDEREQSDEIPLPLGEDPMVAAEGQADEEVESVNHELDVAKPIDTEEGEIETSLDDENGYLPQTEAIEPEPAEDGTFDEDQYIAVLESQIPKLESEGALLPVPENDTIADEQEYDSAIEEETALPVDKTVPETQIDDEVFDEITGIDDIKFEQDSFKLIVEDGVIPRDADETVQEEDDDTGLVLHEAIIEEPEDIGPGMAAIPDVQPTVAMVSDELNEEEKLIIGNIAATDFFAFGDKFNNKAAATAITDKDAGGDAAKPEEVVAHHTNKYTLVGDERVSKYHDDKMPYSFMWWLDKTRREHSGTYQPYTPYKQVTPDIMHKEVPGELQQQYYENIFHVGSIEHLSKQEPAFDAGKKEDLIIERFIKEEPQIKPPSNDKLDNENKAKKSAEDQDALVSETLARIYIDQMLYHKAIATYKKLLLKFPEKSSYFVAQIELLERKIN
ncbi:hypothetical protein [uncultured Mucilaginibacter sp.]|uniref:hypothetical protein n=1 Tax=uncultured Mucilaginibacter sp. TaxID=797541 RepID=UPI0025D10037|nr:hypothetical protein [uncultured Mucilaginibacter sp.]